MTKLFFGNLPFPIYGVPGTVDQGGSTSHSYAERDHGLLRTVDCNHYRAVPLADGTHLLFTDPETGHLWKASASTTSIILHQGGVEIVKCARRLLKFVV